MTDVGLRAIPNEPDLEPAPPIEPAPAPRTNGHQPKAVKATPAPSPHDIDAERSLLGAAMLGNLQPLLELPDTALYGPGHGHIAQAVRQLVAADRYVDSVTVAALLEEMGLLDQAGGRQAVAQIVATTPAIGNAASYARIVHDHWRARELERAGDDIRRAASERGADAAAALLPGLLERTAPRLAADHLDVDLDTFLQAVDDQYDWLVPDLLERGDRVIITGPEGGGKSTLLRQIAVQLASGIHPFTGVIIDPQQVLLVDCENSPRQARRALTGLRATAGDNYTTGRLRLRVLGQAVDLARPDILADLAARIDQQNVDVLIIGPLYKLIGDDPVKELPSKAVADAIDTLRARRGSAVIIEAHSPYADGSRAKRPIRPYGASLWSRWPEFGIYLGDDGKIQHWRGQRDQRAWPPALKHATGWPWAPDLEVKPWDGPTECVSAVVALLDEIRGEHSTKQLGSLLRERGNNYRDSTIASAARQAADEGRIDRRTGPRGSYLYSPAIAHLGDDQPDTWETF